MAPFSGQAAAFGHDMLQGAQLAIDDANAANQLGGKRLVLDQADDKADPTQAPTMARKLISDGVAGVVGTATSATTLAAEQTFDQAKVPLVAPMAGDPAVTEQRLAYVFRAIGRWDQEGPVLANAISGRTKQVAIISDQAAYGQTVATAVNSALGSAGIQPSLNMTVDSGTQDFGSLITTKLKPQPPGAVFYGGYAAEAGALAKQLANAGLRPTLALDDASLDQAFLKAAGAAAEGALLAFPPDPAKVASAAPVLAAYKQRFGTTASLYALSTYDSVRLVADALARSGSTDGSAIQQALATTSTFSGAYWGPMTFDAKHDLQAKTYVLWTVKAGKFEQLP
ncbi:MAG: branched-chain amino acid ABC transporter substrate-binding protein [Chloroflexi bacterium]|nr:branched-chain amino acid ABC transporter substrate-binding protein [Chloroflexota bacterium]